MKTESGPLPASVLLIVVFSFLSDQAFKIFALRHLKITVGESIPVTPFLDLALVWNDGVSYGWLSNGGVQGRYALIAFVAIVCILIVIWMRRTTSRQTALGLAFILGGALGNLLDRLLYGSVIDLFLFHIGPWSWYVFNLADVWICIGGAMAIFTLRPRDDRRAGV